MENDGFQISDASLVSEVDKRTIAYWADSGFIEPSLQAGTGKGSQRLYSFEDVVWLRVSGRLRLLGLSLQAMRPLVKTLKPRLQWHLESRNGTEPVYLVASPHEMDFFQGQQWVHLIITRQMDGPWVILDLTHTIMEMKQGFWVRGIPINKGDGSP